MGGTPPVGYKPAGRTLDIVDEHANTVRHIFRSYLELGTVRLLMQRLATDGVIKPKRMTASGRWFGGRPFSRGQIYAMLKNAIYAGDIAHNGKVYLGLHKAIIDRDTWDRAQQLLAGHVQGDRPEKSIAHCSPLAGLIADEVGQPLVAAHSCKGSRRYRYYVSRALQHGSQTTVEEAARIMRRAEIGALVVLDDDGAFRCIISEREIVHQLGYRGRWVAELPVARIMATDVPLASPDDTISALMAAMTTHRARHIPVMNDRIVVGIVSTGDAVKFRLQEKSTEIGVLRDLAQAHLLAA